MSETRKPQDFIVEIHLVVPANSVAEADAVGERVVRQVQKRISQRTIASVYVADVRGEEEGAE